MKQLIKKIAGPTAIRKAKQLRARTKVGRQNTILFSGADSTDVQEVWKFSELASTFGSNVLVTDQLRGPWKAVFEQSGQPVICLPKLAGFKSVKPGKALTLNNRFLSGVHTELSAISGIRTLTVLIQDNDVLGVQIARELGGHVAPGGIVYLSTASQSEHEVSKLVDDIHEDRYRALARMFSVTQTSDESLVLRKKIASWAKIREYDSLKGGPLDRSGTQKTLVSLPGYSFGGRAQLTSNDHASNKRFRDTYEVPETCLRVSEHVRLFPGQVAVKDGVLLPESFRHPFYGELDSRHIVSQSHFFADELPDAHTPRYLEGAYFMLDSEVQRHFGHVLTEQLPRLWCLDDLLEISPEVRFIVSAKPGTESLASFEYELFAAFGIPSDRITVVNEPVTVEVLYTATPMFSNPNYVDLRLRDTFDRAQASTNSDKTPDKVFIARKPGGQRSCHNASAVEQIFSEAGYEIVFPEDLSISDQISLFRNVKEIGGYGGSGMLTALFAPKPIKLTVIASKSYTAVNEYMIAELGAHEIGYFWCEPDLHQPADRWSEQAFMSDFTFDEETDSDRLREWISQPAS